MVRLLILTCSSFVLVTLTLLNSSLSAAVTNHIDKLIYNERALRRLTAARGDVIPFASGLIPLGQIDGKNYSAANAPRDWISSVEFCRRSNLKLATIDTADQLRTLANDLKSRTSANWAQGYFWTSGQDFLQQEGVFHWFTSGAPVNLSLRHDLRANMDWNCVQLSWTAQIFDYFCSDGDALPLCEG